MKPIRQPYCARKGAFGAVALASALLLLAGCGGGSSSNKGVANLSSGKGSTSTNSESDSSSPESSAGAQKKMVAYSRCMRSHGVAGFPEPSEGKLVVHGSSGGGLNPQSAQFQAAEKACRKLQPNGGTPSPQAQAKAQERALSFSRCMRSHGVPNFPNPTFSAGRVTQKVNSREGLDPNSPQFKSAAKACQAYFGPPGGKGGAGSSLSTQGGAGGGHGGSQSSQVLAAP